MMNKLFGNQISHAIKVIRVRSNPVDLGPMEERVELFKQFSRVIMQIIISLIVIVAGFYIILNYEDANLQKLASGFIGTVIGYWLR